MFRTPLNAYDSDAINKSIMQKIRKMQYEFDDFIGQMDKYLQMYFTLIKDL